MAESGPPEKDEAAEAAPDQSAPAVENRWWVDSGTSLRERRSVPADRPEGTLLVERIFRVGRGFDQDRARADLTDTNLNLLREANPAEGSWGYLSLIEDRSPTEQIEKVKRSLRLPRWARGVLVDSGVSIRAIATGDPFGERIVELNLGAQPSFDAWARGDWVHEKTFRSKERALREASGLIVRYLRRRD